MWEMLLLQVVVSAESRSCGIYIAGRVHIGAKKRSCALRYIWERRFTSHCKSEAIRLCWKSTKEEHVFPTGKTQGKCQLGTKQQMWHLSLEKTKMKFFGSSTHLNRFVFEECVQKSLNYQKPFSHKSSGSLSSSVTGDITGGNLPVSHFSLFSGRKHNLMQHLPLFRN